MQQAAEINHLQTVRSGKDNRSRPAGVALVAVCCAESAATAIAVAGEQGYEIRVAESGADAVLTFQEHQPGLVILDARLTGPGGYEAAGRIRRLCQQEFVPILMADEDVTPESLTRCVDSGADDLVAIPLQAEVLRAKLKAMARIRANNSMLRGLYDQIQRDESLAERVFSRVVSSRNVNLFLLRTYLRGLSRFSGDVLLTEISAAGSVFVLLGDFTGHGLGAALGAMPAAETFRAMSGKGFTPEQILVGINGKLNDLLPTGMFMTAQFIEIDRNLDSVRIINHGMPDVYLIDGRDGHIRERAPSGGLPLGVAGELETGPATRKFRILPGDRILLSSDGVIEARNPDGVAYGTERLVAAIESTGNKRPVLDAVVDDLTRFRGGAEQADDISVVEIPCEDELVMPLNEQMRPQRPAPTRIYTDSEFSVTLRPTSLRKADIVPRLFGQIRESMDIESRRSEIFTVISELYVNALDHGVLRLDSRLKSSVDGFSSYFVERERRLASLERGWVSFRVEAFSDGEVQHLSLGIADSGPGFDVEAVLERPVADDALTGRGLHMIRKLATETRFMPPGNKIEVVFRW